MPAVAFGNTNDPAVVGAYPGLPGVKGAVAVTM